MRRITDSTVVAAMSSIRVKAALLRSVSVNLAALRRVLMRECKNVRKCECSSEVSAAHVAWVCFASNLENDGVAMQEWVFDCMGIAFNDIS